MYKQYACRKTLADRRVRVRGRFARNNELVCHDDHEYQQMVPKTNELDHTRKQIDFCCEDDVIGDAVKVCVYIYIYVFHIYRL